MSLPRPTQVAAIHTQVERFELTRPYAISFRAMMDHVENVVVRLETADGHVGHGAACPEHFVTGETNEACRAALADDRLEWLLGQDVRTLSRLCRELGERLPAAPAARAALDMALHDLYAQHLDLPLVEVLGRAHTRLPTSITIGIKPLQETLDEAAEYIERGFRILKVKLGESLEQDLERLFKLHERYGDQVSMRVDPNQGYGPADVEAFVAKTETLGLEFLEQPMAADAIEAMRALPEHIRARVAADESLLNERDAINLLRPVPACGIFNIKLMKCGGVHPALRIADIAHCADIALMWGCMDESIISISAALHAALASPATRYLDLDGSLDLARDVVTGGFILEDGQMRTSDAPGLGVTPLR